MQPRVISIHAPKIPCWKLTEQMQHLCKQLKRGAKGASFASNDNGEVQQHIAITLQGESAVPFGHILRTLL